MDLGISWAWIRTPALHFQAVWFFNNLTSLNWYNKNSNSHLGPERPSQCWRLLSAARFYYSPIPVQHLIILTNSVAFSLLYQRRSSIKFIHKDMTP